MTVTAGTDRWPGRFGTRARLEQLALTLTFIVFFLVQLAHHRMWRDEINAFGLAMGSPKLSTLFHYLHYEGHPWVWYVLLWVLSRISVLPVAIKCLQAVIGTGILGMIGLASPFRTWEKLLIFTCYFVSFEYTVIARMYGVVLLLALIYIRRRALYPARLHVNATLLGLMACTDVTGVVISFSLLLEYACATYEEWRGRGSFSAGTDGARPSLLPAANRTAMMVTSLGIYAAFLLSAVITITPAKDISTASTSGMFALGGNLGHLGRVVVSYIVKPYFPTVTGRSGHYWDAATSGHKLLFSACVPAVLAAYWFVLRRRKSLLVLVGTTCFLMISIGQLLYYGSIRHFGMTFLAFLLALWLLRSAGDAVHWPAHLLLALTAIGGAQMAWGSWQRPFSQEGNAAEWIVAHGLENGPIAAHLGFGAWLARPVYMMECGCVEEFLIFRRGWEYHGATLTEMLNAARYAGGRTFTYVGLEPLSAAQTKTLAENGLSVLPLASFQGSEVEYEDVYLYAVTPQQKP